MSLKDEIQLLLKENIDLGLYIYDTKSQEAFMFNEEELFPLASIAKFITAIFSMSKKASSDAVFQSIAYHDAEAYIKLNSLFTENELNHRLSSIGLEIKVNLDNRSLIENIATPKSVFLLLHALYERKLLDEESTTFILQVLEEQSDVDGFRLNGRWLHMTGGLDGVCNDVGFLVLEDRVLILVGFVKTKHSEIGWYELEALLKSIGEQIQANYKMLTNECDDPPIECCR